MKEGSDPVFSLGIGNIKVKKERLQNFINQLVEDEEMAKKFNDKIKQVHHA
jgi:polyhydroxyalkanoate synthesis regulator phasin